MYAFEVSGTDLTQRFCDQFSPMLIDQNDLWSLSDSTIIRMPLSSDCLKVGSDFGSNRIKHITDIFMEHGSRALLFLKSVLQVILSSTISVTFFFLSKNLFLEYTCILNLSFLSFVREDEYKIGNMFSPLTHLQT